jgi:oligopeptidase A
VEVASQFMENWCLAATTLKGFARHAETNEAIPAELLARVRAAKNYRAAAAMLRQLSFATVDMRLHVSPPVDPNALKNRVFDALTPGTTIPEDRFLNAFKHIFSGGYAAGYYGYKWSEVMSADVFGAFEEVGLDDEAAVRRIGRKYRDTFLALGGSVDPMEVFKLFRGRAPTIDALLRQTGLKDGDSK